MSRNANRRQSGDSTSHNKPEVADAAPTNGAANLTFATPTEFVDLPSRGRFYPEEHPLSGVDSLEIKYMTAKEEDILTSQTLLRKGLALERLLQSVIIDKRINPETMLVGDRNAVLVASRITGYGEEYTVAVSCPECTASTDYDFNLSKYQFKESDDICFTKTEDDTHTARLPASKLEVEVRMLTGKDEKYLLEQRERKKKKKLPETMLTDQLKRIIVSINGITDTPQIKAAISNLPARDSRYLRTIYDQLVPNIDMRQEFECPSCGAATDLEVPFTTAFFWPK